MDVSVLQKFEDVKHLLRPLDLIMFSGSEGISKIIKILQSVSLIQQEGDVDPGEYSHLGMVVTSEILDSPLVESGKIYVWESTMSGELGQDKVNNLQGATFGVQLRNFEELGQKYLLKPRSKISIAQLNDECSLWRNDMKKAKATFTEIFHRYNGKTYDVNFVSLGASLFSCLRRYRKKAEKILGSEEWLFCSELVAQVFIDMGIYAPTVNPKNVVPMDFVGYESDPEEKGGIPPTVKYPLIHLTF